MEPLPQRPETPLDRQLPQGGNKIQRLSVQTQGLAQEMKRWVDLRIELAKLEVRQEIEAQRTKVMLLVGMAILGALGGFFLLVTIALALGALLGHPAWGFLIVTVLLLAGAAIVRAVMPGMVKEARNVTVERDVPDEVRTS